MKQLGFLAMLLSSFGLWAQIRVDDTTYSVEELVRDILVDSNCAETSNYSSKTGSAEGLNGIGYFQANGTDFPYEEGIVLSTGRAKLAEGPNVDIHDSGSETWAGDDDLRAITNSDALYNASYIQFDFVPYADRITFNFLFASEEYQENFQCVFGDVFAFILTDSKGVSKNLAVIPNSELPVRVTTIRPGVNEECLPRNLEYFDKINDENSAISFHGQTKSFTAESKVVPGDAYNIKLVIADNRDSQVDSAVFLEAGSFTLGADLGENRTVEDGNPMCIGETIVLDATAQGVSDYRWYKDEVERVEWAGLSKVDVAESGKFSVDVGFSTSCVANGGLTLEFILPPQIMSPPVSLNFCDVDATGKQVVDLTVNSELILGGQDPKIYQVTYYLSEEDARAFKNAIGNPTAYELSNASETVFVRISSGNSCYEIATFELKLLGIDFRSELQEEYVLCLGADGETLEPLPVLDTGLSTSVYSFAWYRGELSPENKIADASDASFTASEAGTYIVQLQNMELGCEFSLAARVFVSPRAKVFEIDFVSDPFAENTTIDIVAEGDGNYLYSVDGLDFTSVNRFEGLSAGEHTAYITDAYKCSVLSKKFMVVDFPRFFSPNGDGVNDTWSIINVPQMENPEVTIYNQYGMLMRQLSGNLAWDGTFNGGAAPSNDYWFRIEYTKDGERKEFKSHFSLKR
ncbi:T9SS type B sorting domain-containing protein [Zobellia galactanivorans]|uniref:Conserved hypothetical periplasmic protein n=1 Tax=Zobellia galactanivorans (strain DSM 12802 / CCUG 47099 / CIP 106680 / NCIMB 13871 / Dsij) TaxID=63186 RepID=G0LCI8_ZOBGA|nr:choice-of-anchor L domain-containing protein [Zobellia galactanivorans]CAZ96954.1 Conserved hypothetical periplasmic protein [Zobellia galactanivorans]